MLAALQHHRSPALGDANYGRVRRRRQPADAALSRARGGSENPASWRCGYALPAPHPQRPDGDLPVGSLFAEWPPGTVSPTDYWLPILPTDIRLCDLVKLAEIVAE